MSNLKYIVFCLLIIFCLFNVNNILASSPSPSPSPASSPSPSPATSPSAAGSNGTVSGGTVNLADVSPVGETDVPTIIGNVIKAVLGVIGAVALFMFVYGGILLLSSGGRPDQIKKGKDVLIWAIIGIAVILASYALVEFIISALTATA
jgi:hypothetical protein